MTSKLTRETVYKLENLLGSIAKLVSNNETVSASALEIILASEEIESTSEVLAELQRWTALLQQAKSATDKTILDAITEALIRRGIQQASAQLAVSLIAGLKANTASAGYSPSQIDLVVSPDHLDFGTLSFNQGATKTINFQGDAGTITSDSDRIIAKPEHFDAGETRIAITVQPQSGASVLWATLKIASSSRTVYIPVVAQWSESSASTGATPPTPNLITIPPSGTKSVTSTSPEEDLTPPRKSGPTSTVSPPNRITLPHTTSSTKTTSKRTRQTKPARPWKPIIITCIVGVLAVVALLAINDPDADESIAQGQTPFSTSTQDVNTRSPTPNEELASEATSIAMAVIPTNTPMPTETPLAPSFPSSWTEAESNNGPSSALAIASSSSGSGVISTPGDQDYYVVNLQRPTWLEFEVVAQRNGSDLDSLLVVLDDEGQVIASDDDSFGRDSYLRLNLTDPGRYYAVISELDPGDSGPGFTYQLITRDIATDDNDDTSTATPLEIGESTSGQITTVGDRDFFRFAAQAGQLVDVEIRLPDGSRLDSYIALLDSQMQELASNDDYNGRASYLRQLIPVDGTYYVMVSELSDDNGGDEFIYELQLANVPTDDNNSISNSTSIAPDEIVTGGIDYVGDVDYFRFSAKAEDTVRILIDNRTINSRLRGLITLMDESGTSLIADRDVIEWRIPVGGTYHFRIESDSENDGGVDYGYQVQLLIFPGS